MFGSDCSHSCLLRSHLGRLAWPWMFSVRPTWKRKENRIVFNEAIFLIIIITSYFELSTTKPDFCVLSKMINTKQERYNLYFKWRTLPLLHSTPLGSRETQLLLPDPLTLGMPYLTFGTERIMFRLRCIAHCPSHFSPALSCRQTRKFSKGKL